jgi:hypothetical protein
VSVTVGDVSVVAIEIVPVDIVDKPVPVVVHSDAPGHLRGIHPHVVVEVEVWPHARVEDGDDDWRRRDPVPRCGGVDFLECPLQRVVGVVRGLLDARRTVWVVRFGASYCRVPGDHIEIPRGESVRRINGRESSSPLGFSNAESANRTDCLTGLGDEIDRVDAIEPTAHQRPHAADSWDSGSGSLDRLQPELVSDFHDGVATSSDADESCTEYSRGLEIP